MDILQQFIQNGYIEIDLSELSIHNVVYDKLANFEIKWADGDLLENLPEYSEVISNSKVTSVLKTVLGDKYIEHPHVAMFDGRYTPNKVNHRDWPTHFTQEVRTRKPYYFNHWNRHHHCRYVQVFYCPHVASTSKAGTGFYVGSQYYDDDFDAHLDAVNSSALSEILRERTERSQIIMISLKDTILSRVDSMFGIYHVNGITKILKYQPNIPIGKHRYNLTR